VTVCLQLARALGATRRVDDFYTVALDALESGLGVRRSSILLFDDEGVMRFKAWRGLSDVYRRAVEGHSPWRPDTPDAAPIVVPDVRADPALAALQSVILAEGIAALTFVPLVSGGRVTGKFMLYYDSPHAADASELELASVIAAQIAFAVERTQSESRARQSEERLRFALEAGTMGTWEWEPRSQAVRWSDNLERIHGYEPGTFDGTFDAFQREIHPEDRARVLDSIERALAAGAPHEVEYRILTRRGDVRWLEAKGRVERDEHGNVVRLSGVCMDVTVRKQTEAARAEATEQASRATARLAAIVESSGDAIVSKNLDGIIMSWNRAAERLFGHTVEEAVGRSITLIIPEDRLPEEDDVLTRVRAGRSIEMETIRQAKDGRRFPISLTVSPIRDREGRIIGASKIARDISDRRRVEAERAQLHARLATLVTASASLLNAPDAEAVAAATVATAQDLLVADGYALWANHPDDGSWRMIAFHGVSERFATRVIAGVQGAASAGEIPFTEPWAVSDVSEQPLLAPQLAA
jgi:PAS domain S-box-containing protein